ncbi:MAG TPA: hypothetical protein VMB49_03900 [Acidobacteriaceae bacterium]|nr:hypothetical protein [Acidobacteriaceae bacterium]
MKMVQQNCHPVEAQWRDLLLNFFEQIGFSREQDRGNLSDAALADTFRRFPATDEGV